MFIDALTPRAPVPSTKPQAEHTSLPRLGTSAAQADLHARVHGDGSSCPVCLLRVNAPAGPMPDPVSARAALLAWLRLR